MTSVHDLSDAELRDELARTRSAYAEYVEDVGEHPSHASRDLGEGARRHLDVREELDRRGAVYHDDLTVRDDEQPAGAGSGGGSGGDPDAGGQRGGGHVDPGEQAAAREASYADDHDEHEDLPDKLDPQDIEPYA
jgi:hypothetical protein